MLSLLLRMLALSASLLLLFIMDSVDRRNEPRILPRLAILAVEFLRVVRGE